MEGTLVEFTQSPQALRILHQHLLGLKGTERGRKWKKVLRPSKFYCRKQAIKKTPLQTLDWVWTLKQILWDYLGWPNLITLAHRCRESSLLEVREMGQKETSETLKYKKDSTHFAGPKHLKNTGRNIASRKKNESPYDSQQVNRDLSPITKRNQIQPTPEILQSL